MSPPSLSPSVSVLTSPGHIPRFPPSSAEKKIRNVAFFSVLTHSTADPPFHHSSVDKFHMKCHLPLSLSLSLSLSISVSVLTHSREDSTIPSFFSWNENSMRLHSLPPLSSLPLCLSVLTHSMADSNIPSVFISRQIQ